MSNQHYTASFFIRSETADFNATPVRLSVASPRLLRFKCHAAAVGFPL